MLESKFCSFPPISLLARVGVGETEIKAKLSLKLNLKLGKKISLKIIAHFNAKAKAKYTFNKRV